MIADEKGLRLMMLRILITAAILLVSPLSAEARTYAAIVQDYRTGKVLHSRSADRQIYPASLTKMMTLYMLFDALESRRLSMNSNLRVSKRAEGMAPSKLGLRAGQTIKVKDAILALVTKSANDVAVVVAEALAESEVQFAIKMTEKARSLGMTRTVFKNASGLNNRRQISTARDMATLSIALIRNHSKYYRVFKTTSFRYNGKLYKSHHDLLRNYPGMDGLKTGYISWSGFNLAASAVRGNQRLVTVVIGGKSSKSRNAQVAKLMDLGFERIGAREDLLLSIGPPQPKPTSNVFMVTAKPAFEENVKSIEPAGPAYILAENESSQRTLPIVVAPGADQKSPQIALNLADYSDIHGFEIPKQKPPVKADQVGQLADAEERGVYGVQVGAYTNPDSARNRAVEVAHVLPDILLKGQVDVSALRGGKKTIYRARLVGFNKQLATNACTLLARKKLDCLVVRTEKVQLAGDSYPYEG